MSFFEDASLVLIPSAQKTSKVYSVKPTDGTGDLTFTRSNDTATRVGPDGLIEKVRTNLILQSNTFNTTWASAGSGGATVTSGQADPNGGTSAWLLAKGGTSGRIEQNITMAANEQTFSIVAKKGTSNFFLILVFDGTTAHSSYFNLDTGAVGTQSNAVGSIVSLGSGWYRCSVTSTNLNSSGVIQLYISDSDGGVSGTTGSVYIYQSQFENGVATDYIATTSAAVSVGPVANVPRLDYLNSSCPRLLLEPQRTNALTYSEQFNNAAWTPTGVTVAANTAISPSGYQDADTLTFGASASQNIYNFPTSAIGANTFSIYAKTASGTKDFRFRIDTGSGPAVSSDFTATTTWQRFTFTATTTAANLVAYIFNDSVGTAGNLILWGAQLEAGAYATSYIPTLGAAVTRGADASYKASVSGLIGQTEGTLYAEVQNNSIGSTSGSDNVVLSVEGATNNDVIAILYQPLGDILLLAIVGGSTQVLITYNAGVTSSPKKIAVAYKNNDYALYVDGVLRGTDTSASVPTCSNIGLGNYYNGGSIQTINSKIVNQAILFPSRLSNSDLAALTA